MKIAIVSTIENYSWAGTEEVWAQFAQYAMVQGHEIVLLADKQVASSEQVSVLKAQGLKVLSRKPFRPIRAYLLKESIYSDYKDFDTFNADVILINSGALYDVTNLPYLYNFISRQNIPKVFFCHFVADGYTQAYKKIIVDFFQSMSKIIFVSNHNKKLAQRQLALSIKDADVIANQSKVYLENALDWPDDSAIQLGCVARFETMWKGHDVLLEVLSSEKWQKRNWHLNLYGDGPDKLYIESLIRFYKLESRVTLHGYVKDIKSIWAHCHIKVLASRGEGMPLSVIEAMMCGRPVVVTDVGGNREIISHGVTGWIADASTTYSFGQNMELAWEEKSQWKSMGIQAHEDAKKMSRNNPPKQLLDILTQIVC
jgi:glycosyltransferase involved in cell wall biosynthesis